MKILSLIQKWVLNSESFDVNEISGFNLFFWIHVLYLEFNLMNIWFLFIITLQEKSKINPLKRDYVINKTNTYFSNLSISIQANFNVSKSFSKHKLLVRMWKNGTKVHSCQFKNKQNKLIPKALNDWTDSLRI